MKGVIDKYLDDFVSDINTIVQDLLSADISGVYKIQNQLFGYSFNP